MYINPQVRGSGSYYAKILFTAGFIVLMLTNVLSAESIFLKDGSIIEAAIKSENDTSYKLETPDKQTTTIQRKKVMRITSDNSYKTKRYLKTKDGKTIEGYIVEETVDNYVIREKIDSPAEFTVDKADIKATSTEKFINSTTYYLLGAVPGVAQVYAGQDTHGLVFIGAFAASAGFTGWAWYNYDKKQKEYNDLPRGSEKSVFDSSYDAYKTSAYILAGGAIFTGLVYIANWVDVIWFSAPDFKSDQKTAEAGDVFYNIAVGTSLIPFYGCNAINGITPGPGMVSWGSMFALSAGVRF